MHTAIPIEQNAMAMISPEDIEPIHKMHKILRTGKEVLLELDLDSNIRVSSLTLEEYEE